jgi:flagellin-like protein
LPRSFKSFRSKRLSGKIRKRAISEIIGSLLMILVVVAASAIIFGIANNSFASWSSNFSSLFGSSGNQISEKIVVEQVQFNESGTSLGANLYVRNDGENLASISGVYVTNVTAGSNFVISDQFSSPRQMLPGEFEVIAAVFTPLRGSTYSFIIATSLGNTVAVNAKA